MENDISSADSAVLAANDLELRQKEEEEKDGGEIFVSLINGKSVMGEENPPRADGVRYQTRVKRDSDREREKAREFI